MPFAGYHDFNDCVMMQVRKGKTKEQAQKVCGTLQAKSEAEIKGKGVNKNPKPKKMKNNYSESAFYKIDGVALVAGKSRNNVMYTQKHLESNDGKEIKIFVGDEHIPNSDNVIGRAQLKYLDGQLRFEGKIRNTMKHPDVVDLAGDGLLDVSIGASKVGKEKIMEDGTITVDNIDIEHLALVGTPGVKDAKIEAVMAESFRIDKNEKEDSLNESNITIEKPTDEVNKMSEELLEENKKLKAQLEDMQTARKKDLVESILKINSELKESELMEKSEQELKLIESYEKKIKESEEEKEKEPSDEESAEDAEKKEKNEEDGNEEGAGVVEPEKKESEEDVKESFQELGGIMTLSESAYEKFNIEMQNKY